MNMIKDIWKIVFDYFGFPNEMIFEVKEKYHISDWYGIWKLEVISEDFIRQYADIKRHNESISANPNLSIQFIAEFQDVLAWWILVSNSCLSLDLILEYAEKTNHIYFYCWGEISRKRVLSLSFIEKAWNYLSVHWSTLQRNPSLTYENLNYLSKKFHKNLEIDNLIQNQQIPLHTFSFSEYQFQLENLSSRIDLSETFIEKHIYDFDIHRLIANPALTPVLRKKFGVYLRSANSFFKCQNPYLSIPEMEKLLPKSHYMAKNPRLPIELIEKYKYLALENEYWNFTTDQLFKNYFYNIYIDRFIP